MSKIAITGHFGSGNLGDEAILAGMLRSFESAFGKDSEVAVFSNDPKRTHALHGVGAVGNWVPGTRFVTGCLKRLGLSKIEASSWWLLGTAHGVARREIASADVLCIGGGGLLSDEVPRTLPRWLGKLRLAKKSRTKVMIYAVGAIGLDTDKGREYGGDIISLADAITVRDEESRECLLGAGVPSNKIAVTADPAFNCVPAPPDRVREIFEMEGIPWDRPTTGMVLAPYFDSAERFGDARRELSNYRSALANSIIRLVRDEGCNLAFLPFQHPGDLRFTDGLLEECGLASHPGIHVFRTPLSPSEALGVMARFSSVVTIRLHGMIFSAMAGVPFVPIGYSPKTRSFLKRLDYLDYALDVGDFSSETMLGMIGRVQDERKRITDSLSLKVATMKERERANTSILKKLLEGKEKSSC